MEAQPRRVEITVRSPCTGVAMQPRRVGMAALRDWIEARRDYSATGARLRYVGIAARREHGRSTSGLQRDRGAVRRNRNAA